MITVPAHFNDGQREATAKAGKIAGLNVLKMINEPTAAALAYGHGLSAKSNKIFLVFDLGGGTLDVTILIHKIGAGGEGFFNAEITEGDTHLGGEDFTRVLVEYCREEFRKSSGHNLADNRLAMVRLREECERAKKQFADPELNEVKIQVDRIKRSIKFETVLTRDKYKELISGLLKRCT